MKRIGEALGKFPAVKRPKNISTEFQMYGVYLAEQLEDTKHYSLYIKLAKTLPRKILDEALSYVKDYPNAKSKAKLFMWRMKQIRVEVLSE
ncbi:hypothetical protein HYW44_00515 [Candidatus Daviesbacteria bacterium]|nr:hypothetical protein [Candidatus Daviesbacteria bacterium]